MKTTVDSDLIIDATEEAKICLECDKVKCAPNGCKRLKRKLEELKSEEKVIKR